MKFEEMKEIVLKALVEAGWEPVDEISMKCTTYVAMKSYPTHVGNKVALACFIDTPEECCRVGGEYLSEGTNALSTSSAYIWYGAKPANFRVEDVPLHRHALRESVTKSDLLECAKAFAAEAERKIADTYAVRLLRRNLAKAS